MPFHRVPLCCALALMLAGCAAPASPHPEQVGAAAAANDEPIRFRADPLPDDERADAGPMLRFASAARLALDTDPQVQAALARVRAALADAEQARLLPNPILDIAVRLPQAGGPAVIEASLTADLLALLHRPGRISVADHRLREAAARAVSSVLDVLAETQQTYTQAQSLEAESAVLRDRADLLQRLHTVVRSRLDAGEATRLDLATVESQQAELRVEIAERARALREARLKLARLIGRPSAPADWAVEAWQPPPRLAGDEPRWIAAALQHRPEIQAQVSQLAALGVEVELARWAFLDGLAAGADAERDGGEWAVGPIVTTPIPLFDWGQARRAQAEARRQEAMHTLTQIRRVVIQEVRQALASYRSAVAVHDAACGDLIPLATLRRRDAEAAYKAGEADTVTLILADQDLQAARARMIQLQQQVTLEAIRLHRAVGGPGHTPDADPGPIQPEH